MTLTRFHQPVRIQSRLTSFFGGELFTNNTHQYSYNIQNKLQFSKAFNDENRLNALIGMELRSTTNKGINNTVWGYVPDRGEVITSPTTLQAFEPITGSQTAVGAFYKKNI